MHQKKVVKVHPFSRGVGGHQCGICGKPLGKPEGKSFANGEFSTSMLMLIYGVSMVYIIIYIYLALLVMNLFYSIIDHWSHVSLRWFVDFAHRLVHHLGNDRVCVLVLTPICGAPKWHLSSWQPGDGTMVSQQELLLLLLLLLLVLLLATSHCQEMEPLCIVELDEARFIGCKPCNLGSGRPGHDENPRPENPLWNSPWQALLDLSQAQLDYIHREVFEIMAAYQRTRTEMG